jgi:hypothetical protein
VILRGLPTRIGGALVSPNCRRLLRIVVIERGLHRAVLAISAIVSELLRIISRINSRLEASRFGAIIPLSHGVGSRGQRGIRRGRPGEWDTIGRKRTKETHDYRGRGVLDLSGILQFYTDAEGGSTS